MQKKKSLKNRKTVADYLIVAAFLLFTFITFYPFFYTVVGSFNQGTDYIKGGIWLYPRVFTTDNYYIIIMDSAFWNAFKVTVMRTAIGTVCSLLFTSFVAYCMSRKNLRCRSFFQWVNIFTMFFSGGLVPYYIVILILGLYDTFTVYIIPALYSVYNMIVICSFFGNLPNELHESAMLDGASELRIYWGIYMPLSKPVLATVGLWLAIGKWNDYRQTLIYTQDKSLITVQYYLMKMIKEATLPDSGLSPDAGNTIQPETVTFATIVVSTIPIICVYPYLSRFFTKGLMVGSLKG